MNDLERLCDWAEREHPDFFAGHAKTSSRGSYFDRLGRVLNAKDYRALDGDMGALRGGRYDWTKRLVNMNERGLDTLHQYIASGKTGPRRVEDDNGVPSVDPGEIDLDKYPDPIAEMEREERQQKERDRLAKIEAEKHQRRVERDQKKEADKEEWGSW